MSVRIDSIGDGIETRTSSVIGVAIIDYRVRGHRVATVRLGTPPTLWLHGHGSKLWTDRSDLLRVAAAILFAADRMDQANYARHANGNPKRTGVMEGERGSILA